MQESRGDASKIVGRPVNGSPASVLADGKGLMFAVVTHRNRPGSHLRSCIATEHHVRQRKSFGTNLHSDTTALALVPAL